MKSYHVRHAMGGVARTFSPVIGQFVSSNPLKTPAASLSKPNCCVVVGSRNGS